MTVESEPGKKSALQSEMVDLAIIGGGIAGLYCALKYNGKKFKTITIYEASGTLGGRLCTRYFPEDHPEFDAEFGPMRIEPDQQRLLDDLLRQLGIGEKPAGHAARGSIERPFLIDFPAYSSPVDLAEPTYNLAGEERDQQTPIDLLRLAFIRILGRLVVRRAQNGDGIHKVDERAAFEVCLQKGRDHLMLAIASHQREWKGSFQRWIDQLDEPDYQNIREFAEFEYDSGDRIPLWQMGFWNLVSDVLSHDAVMKLRDQGSFYHLIPENPNAVEWLVFWLRGLKTSDKLQGIEGGMSSIIHLIEEAFLKKTKFRARNIRIEKETTLISICSADASDAVRLNLIDSSGRSERAFSVDARHVILAVPKSPLQRIVAQSVGAFPDHVATDISRAWGFPMTKVFAVVKKRWWENEHMANLYAGRVPTRELHYWKSQKTRRGMIMAYADRPGSNFWANYISRQGRQDEPDWFPVLKSWFEVNRYPGAAATVPVGASAPESGEIKSDSTPDISHIQKRRLVYKLVEYLSAIGSQTIRPSDVEYCGIIDWGREPYGAANHTWLAETKSWIVLSQLSAFTLGGAADKPKNIHICGEAYSDYHGFIEGSLRSAAHALHAADPSHELALYPAHAGSRAVEQSDRLRTPTPWLCTSEGCSCRSNSERRRRLEATPGNRKPGGETLSEQPAPSEHDRG